MIMAEEGFDFGSINDFFDEDDDDDLGISIDADSFFGILDEENSDPFSVNPFHPSTDNTQDSGTVNIGNHENVIFQTDYGAASENSAETVEAVEQLRFPSPGEEVLPETNSSFSHNSVGYGVCQLPNFLERPSFPPTQNLFSEFNVSSAGYPNQNFLDASNYDFVLTNGALVNNMKGVLDKSRPSYPWLDDKMALESQVGDANTTAAQVPMYDFFDRTVSTCDSSSSTTVHEASAEPFHWRLMSKSEEKQAVEMKDVKNSELLKGFECKFSEVNKEAGLEGFSIGSCGVNFLAPKEAHSVAGGPSVYFPSPSIEKKPNNVQLLEDPVLFGNSCRKKEGGYAIVQPACVKPDLLKRSQEASIASLSQDGNKDDFGDELCIIDNMSQHGRAHPASTHGKSLIPPQSSTSSSQNSTLVTPFHRMAVRGTGMKATDERSIFQAVVQNLSQPKSEATPPDGSLAVSLLRHQRIALSWMVQKETTSLQCSGGILADDQGLGKTVSTIALILTERPPSTRTSKVTEQGELEALDLDEDDDNQTRNKISMTSSTSFSPRGRPSAGTLIVCPTSVLRQWAEELNNKVSSNANLSVLVYHGSNRTKDPYELAKYDVVLTTYSIVSMEVPKQAVVVKDGNDKRKPETSDASISSSRKRKHSSTSDKRQLKKGVDNMLLEPVARPLARVGWFRVVLDEAQSIKNHKTQVAQACWGLRAKRRWCLSGTPIQNAVDDLYSYFRFLKYDPYSVYKYFCSMVKFPISKNPANGYRKLQALLKTIMLRRTKGTHLDGEPIINLPPKSVKLKKVEFSEVERDFYSRLEADSRAQFQAYAASGTVQQNYVNILLMLLRLRQACDHPLLVRGYDSFAVLKSSIHTAKKLPREKQMCLLNCLEASLAICHICNDPPEDAVVGICGHVFCHQCISERLTGDDNQCPASDCKTQLSVASVFSKGTLKNCLSDNSSQDGSQICSISESSDQRELVESQPASRLESSKIKAALEVLQSLSKPRVSVPDSDLMEPFATNDNKSCDSSNDVGHTNSFVKEKAIVFSQWTRMLDLLEDSLKESSIQYRRLDGTMSVVARDKAVRDFNTLPEVTVMIMSLKAASLGLNLVSACHVLLLDLWWNPTTEDQAIDRAHRIGQTRPVTVVRLTVKDTVEDRILALQQRKRELVASAFGEDESGSHQTRLTVEDLNYLFMA